MHLAVARKLGVFEAGDQAQDAALFGEFQVGLEADQVVEIACQVVPPQLDDGVGAASGARVNETNRAHGTEGQRVTPAFGNDLDRQAAFEEMMRARLDAGLDGVFERVQFDALGSQQGTDEGFVFFFREGTVDVITFLLLTFAVA